jgi:hypothetical protein
LVDCILLRVLGQVQGFRLTQHSVVLDGNPEPDLKNRNIILTHIKDIPEDGGSIFLRSAINEEHAVA